MEFSKINKYCFISVAAGLLLLGCSSSQDSAGFNSNYGNSGYLYVASGSCYGGGVALSAGSGTIARFDLNTGSLINVLADYNSLAAGDMPISVVNKDSSHLYVLVENAGGRRVDIVNKDGSGTSTYLTNTTALNGIMRSLYQLTDGSFLISKTTAIEKFNSAKARVTSGANPYINAPGSTCATSTTLIPSVATLSNGKILYVHAAASPNNKFGLISSTGYVTTADCLATQAAPAATALPTAIVVHPTGKILVSYGSLTATSNFIYSYDVNPTTNTISGATAAFSDPSTINGPSSMTIDPSSQDVLVSNGISSFNNIERFSFNSTTGTLTREGSSPFIPANIYTRCVSGMAVGD